MEWWQIVSAFAALLIAASQFYVWVWPVIKKNAAEKKGAKLKMKGGLEAAIKKARAYRDFGLGELREIIADSRIPEKLRSQVRELESLANECVEWRYECWQIVNTKVQLAARRNEFKELDKGLKLFGRGLEEELYGSDSSQSERIYQAIYEGNLTFELARDAVLKDRWDRSTKVVEDTDVTLVRLQDVIESGNFHKLIDELQKLQKRQTFKTLRKTREALLEKAKLVLKETT